MTAPTRPDGEGEMTEKLYKDSDGNTCTLDALCRKEPEWAANAIRALELRWEKYTDPGVEHPRQAPERIWVQWMTRLRSPVVYERAPAIHDGTIGCYLLAKQSPEKLERSPICLSCGHPLTEADHHAPVCPYCGVA